MATEWMPLTRFEPRSWLLANGEIITEPPLEQTATGRKVRVVGQKTSYFANNLDTLLWDAANTVAKEKNTRVVIEVLSPSQESAMNPLSFNPKSTGPAKVHAIHEPDGATVAWWKFKHPSMPIEATIGFKLLNYGNHMQPNRQFLSVELSMPMIQYRHAHAAGVARITDQTWSQFVDNVPVDLHTAWREFIRDNRPNWPDSALVHGEYLSTAHKGIQRVLDFVRQIEGLDTFQIPDLTDLDNPKWLDLELYETNVNAEFISDLTEWMDSNPLIEGVLNAYQNLLEQMAASGFSVESKHNNDFMAALLAGDKPSLNMTVSNVIDPNTHGPDHDHTVSIHISTGTIIVECSHKAADHGEIAERWEEAMTIAKMTGQEDVLLEFARKAALDRAQSNSKTVIKDRQ